MIKGPHFYSYVDNIEIIHFLWQKDIYLFISGKFLIYSFQMVRVNKIISRFLQAFIQEF